MNTKRKNAAIRMKPQRRRGGSGCQQTNDTGMVAALFVQICRLCATTQIAALARGVGSCPTSLRFVGMNQNSIGGNFTMPGNVSG